MCKDYHKEHNRCPMCGLIFYIIEELWVTCPRCKEITAWNDLITEDDDCGWDL